MATYSKEFKDKLIKLMLPPENKPVKELADEYRVHPETYLPDNKGYILGE